MDVSVNRGWRLPDYDVQGTSSLEWRFPRSYRDWDGDILYDDDTSFGPSNNGLILDEFIYCTPPDNADDVDIDSEVCRFVWKADCCSLEFTQDVRLADIQIGEAQTDFEASDELLNFINQFVDQNTQKEE